MILVTGSTGFVGSHLILHLLEQGENVRAVYRKKENISKTKSLFTHYKKEALFERIEWTEADITDIPSLSIHFRDVKSVYHCAALVSFDPKDEERLRKTNIEGTANIVNLCLFHKIEKLCYVSSIAALGDLQDHEHTVTEETEWNPEKYHSDYAISKHGAEMEVWRAQQEGLDIIIVNPGVILGPFPGNNGSGEIFSWVSKGLNYFTKGITGFVAVEDVVEIMFLLMKSDSKAARFIVIAENIPFEKLVKKTAGYLNVKPPEKQALKWMSSIAWRIDWLFSNLFFTKRKFSKAMAKSLHSTDLYSNDKIKKELGFEFTPVDSILKITAFYFYERA